MSSYQPVSEPPSPEEAEATIASMVASGNLRKDDVERMRVTFQRLMFGCQRKLDNWSDDDDLAWVIAHDAAAGLPGFEPVEEGL